MLVSIFANEGNAVPASTYEGITLFSTKMTLMIFDIVEKKVSKYLNEFL